MIIIVMSIETFIMIETDGLGSDSCQSYNYNFKMLQQCPKQLLYGKVILKSVRLKRINKG